MPDAIKVYLYREITFHYSVFRLTPYCLIFFKATQEMTPLDQ